MVEEYVAERSHDLYRDVYEQRGVYLFSINQNIRSDLNNVSKNLCQVFKDKGCPLSQSATIKNKEKNKEWIITDKETTREYTVINEKDMLNVYSGSRGTGNTIGTGFQGKVTAIRKSDTKIGVESLPQAKIEILQQGEIKHTALTEKDGNYKITDLPDGHYVIRVSKEGYHSTDRVGIIRKKEGYSEPLEYNFPLFPSDSPDDLRDLPIPNIKEIFRVTDEALSYLVNYDWPGNIRDLKSAVESAVERTTLHHTLYPEALPKSILKESSYQQMDIESLPYGVFEKRWRSREEVCIRLEMLGLCSLGIKDTEEGEVEKVGEVEEARKAEGEESKDDLASKTWKEVFKEYADSLLRKYPGNASAAARQAGMSRGTFNRKLCEVGLNRKDYEMLDS